MRMAAVLTTAAAMAVALTACSNHLDLPAPPNGAATAGVGPVAVHASRGAIVKDQFVVVSGVTSLRVTAADIGADLYRVTTPAGASIRPVVAPDPTRVRLQLVSSGLTGAADADVQLSSSVVWQLEVDGGTTDASADLSAGHVSGVDVVGGTSHLDLTLPAPAGTAVIRETGGASAVEVHAAPQALAQVRFAAGGGSATIDGAIRSGIAGGTAVTPTGWAAAPNKYDIELDGGVSAFVLDRG